MPTPFVRPIQTVQLKCGWIVDLVTYFTRGEFEQLQDVWADAAFSEGDHKETPEESRKNLTILRRATNLAKQIAVRKITTPDGQVYEGEGLTPDLVVAIPYNPDEPEDELALRISEITKKKATTDGSTNA